MSARTGAASVVRRSVADNTAILFVSQIVTWSLGFVVAITLPRHLGPALVGKLHLGISLWAIAGIFVLAGTNLLLTKEFARDVGVAERLLGNAVTLQFAAYCGAWVGIVLFSVAAGYDRSTILIIAIVGVSLAFQPLAASGRSVLHGLERMEYVGVTDVVTKSLYAGAILLLVFADQGVYSAAAASSLPAIGSAALLMWFVRRLGVRVRPRLRGTWAVLRQSRVYLMTGLARTTYQQIDVIIISLLVPSHVMGWYTTADGLFSALLFLPVILMTSMLPAFTRLHATGGIELRAMLHRSFDLLVVIAVPVGLGTFVVATPIALRLFGTAFSGTGPVLAILGVVSIFTYVTILIGRYALAIDRQTFWVWVVAGAVVATVLLDVVLVPWTHSAFGNGAIGGALAYLATESAMLAIGVWKLAPTLWSRRSLVRVSKCVAAGLVMMAAVWPLRWHFPAIPVAAGAVAYGSMVVALGVLSREEWNNLRRAARGLTARRPGRRQVGTARTEESPS